MPGVLSVIIKSARGLPVMDRRSELTDAFVELRFGGEFKKTPVCHRSLNPTWCDSLGMGIDFQFSFSEDEQLCEDLLLLRVMDHDTYSAHDAIGRVDIDLSVFLFSNYSPKEISGFFPIFDTMHGLRGELELSVSVNLIPTTNKPTDVLFFASAAVPPIFKLVTIFGLVDELVVNEDPEFQFIDKLRTSRTSNEVRVKVFSQLSAEVRRKIGVKSMDLGANAVLGYEQFFDIEGDTGVVVRGYGTAVFMVPAESSGSGSKSLEHSINTGSSQMNGAGGALFLPLSQQHSGVSPDPAAGTLEEFYSSKFGDLRAYKHIVEYPFFTLNAFSHGGNNGASFANSFITSIGGLVCSRSVKLLDRMEDPEKSLMRDNWWLELRNEIKSHMEAFCCNCVVGYTEFTTMYEDLMVLSAMGTAANLDATFSPQRSNHMLPFPSMSIDLPSDICEQVSPRSPLQNSGGGMSPADFPQHAFPGCFNLNSANSAKCSLLHLPYNDASLPFSSELSLCSFCRSAKVHDVLLATCELSSEMTTVGDPVVVHANVVKKKKRGHGEAEAMELNGLLSFIEHEVQQQLLHKLQLAKMNSCWGLNITLTITQNAIIGLAVGTAAHLPVLPFPRIVDLPPKYEALMLENSPSKFDVVKARKEVIDSFLSASGIDFTATAEQSRRNQQIEAGQEELPNVDLSLDGKQVQAFVVKPLEDNALQLLYKSLLACYGQSASTLSFHCSARDKSKSLAVNGAATGANAEVTSGAGLSIIQQQSTVLSSLNLKKPVMFNSLAMQVCHCDSYRNTLWNSASFSATIDSTLAKFTYKALMKNEDSSIMNVRIQLSGSDNLDDSAILFCTADICEAKHGHDVDSLILSRCPIQITSLSELPDYRIELHLGYINTFFIRETTDLKQFGSTSSFVCCCVNEVLTVLKSRIANVGANALLSFKILFFDINDNWHKNQAQTLLNVRGDIVKLLPSKGSDSI